jgi:hypothetical protein
VVWKLGPADALEPVAVRAGISDYASTQVLAGKFKEGDRLITGTITAGSSQSAKTTPGAPRPTPGGRR